MAESFEPALPENTVGCPECDLLVDLPALSPGQRARCSRCGFVLTACVKDPFGRTLAFSIAALILLAIALSFPFLSISVSGLSHGMTLMQTVSYLVSYDATVIGLLVGVFVIGVPAAMLVWMLLLLTSLQSGRFSGWMQPPTRWLFHLNAWSMVEVFTIGVIVALVKLASMARVELGVAFWAYLAFALLFLLAFSSLDRLTVWTAIDRTRMHAA